MINYFVMLRLPLAAFGRLQNLNVVLVRVNSTNAAIETSDVPNDWISAKPYDAIPGPVPLPVIGNAWRFFPGIGEFSKFDALTMNKSFFVKYGKIVNFGGIPGRKDMVMLYDPEDVEKVYRNEGIWPIRSAIPSFTYYRTVTRKEFFEGAGGALATQGKEWGKFRSIINQPMMQPRVAKVYVGPIDEVANDMMKRIAVLQATETGEMPADFINELYKWAFESIVMIALDTRLGCLDSNIQPDSEGQRMIETVHVILDCLFELDMKLPIWKYISTPTWRRFVKSMDYFTEVCMKHINVSLEKLKSLPPDSEHEPSVLERIIARDPNPKTAVTMALDMMLAGVDTTSHSVAFLLYYLATNPEAQTKLQQEIDEVLPKTSIDPITADNLNDLKYLKACIKESMRLAPVAIGNLRTSVKDMVLQGYQVPKGTDIVLNHMAMSNLEEYFPQPETFIPERWLKGDPNEPMSHKGTHPFVFMPFGFGPRSCVGRRFADLEIEILVTKILRSYRLEWHHPPMERASKLLNICYSPLRLKMTAR